MSFTVATKDLRQALLAVLPHVYPARDGQHSLARVRFQITDQNLLVLATDARSSALAIVSMWGDDDVDESGLTWDLSADSVRKLLAVHKPVKVSSSGGEFEPEQTVLMSIEGEQLHTADISGLLPVGEELILPLLGSDEQFPDVEGYLGEAVYEHVHMGAVYDGQPLTTTFASFDAAVKAYKRPMAVRLLGHGRHRFLITIGESFIGAVSVQHPADQLFDEHHEVLDAWEGWTRRLPQRMRRTTDRAPDDVDVDLVDDPDPEPDDPEPDDPEPGDATDRFLASVTTLTSHKETTS